MKKEFAQFVNKLFESREMAHAYHLSQKNYEYHIALESYYKEIIKLYDTLVESFQGKYGILNEDYELIINAKTNDNVVKYFEDLAKFVEDKKETNIDEKDTYILNVVDEILLLIYQTLFKLKFLK